MEAELQRGMETPTWPLICWDLGMDRAGMGTSVRREKFLSSPASRVALSCDR